MYLACKVQFALCGCLPTLVLVDIDTRWKIGTLARFFFRFKGLSTTWSSCSCDLSNFPILDVHVSYSSSSSVGSSPQIWVLLAYYYARWGYFSHTLLCFGSWGVDGLVFWGLDLASSPIILLLYFLKGRCDNFAIQYWGCCWKFDTTNKWVDGIKPCWLWLSPITMNRKGYRSEEWFFHGHKKQDKKLDILKHAYYMLHSYNKTIKRLPWKPIWKPKVYKSDSIMSK